MPPSPPLASERARMRLIEYHKLRTGAHELLPPAVALDEVDGHHHERIDLEQRPPDWKAALESRRRAGQDHLRVDVNSLAGRIHASHHELVMPAAVGKDEAAHALGGAHRRERVRASRAA